MAESRDKYKEYAAECLRIADQTRDAAQKTRLLQMAQAWQHLSEKIERSEEQD